MFSKASKRFFSSNARRNCGFVTMLMKEGETFKDVTGMQNALKKIEHRGPDNASMLITNSKKAVFGHTRLSIIDLSTAGNQPLSNPEKTIHAVVNGELYDFERIRSELQLKGYKFLTKSDSEIVLHLYQEYGLDMFQHLRGEFAFTLYDENRDLLLVAKDRFGIKPMFYTITDKGIIFGSEMKSFFEMDGVTCEWDTDAIANFTMLAGNGTIFKNVHQVPPGHYAIIRPNSTSRPQFVKYWDFDFAAKDKIETRTEAEMIAGTRAKLEESVMHRLRADVPVGVYLSGGIDSCATLGLANKLLRTHYNASGSIDAFTLSFHEHKDFDEGLIAEKQAKMSGARFHKILVSQGDLADNFEDAVYHGETVSGMANFVAKYMLSDAVHKAGYKVVLTGEGSDETFVGYPWFKTDFLFSSEHNSAMEHDRLEILEFIKKQNVAAGHILAALDKSPELAMTRRLFGTGSSVIHMLAQYSSASNQNLMNLPYKPAESLFIQWANVITPDVIDKLKHKWDPVYGSMYIWAKSMFQNNILTVLGDRMEMAHSIEGRVPFLDHHLVEYVNQLPLDIKLRPDLKNKQLIEKWILREATKDVITDEIYKRVKHPFSAPPSAWNKEGKFYQYKQQMLRSDIVDKIPFLDKKKLVGFLDHLHSNDQHTPQQLQQMDMLMIIMASIAAIQKKFNPK